MENEVDFLCGKLLGAVSLLREIEKDGEVYSSAVELMRLDGEDWMRRVREFLDGLDD